MSFYEWGYKLDVLVLFWFPKWFEVLIMSVHHLTRTNYYSRTYHYDNRIWIFCESHMRVQTTPDSSCWSYFSICYNYQSITRQVLVLLYQYNFSTVDHYCCKTLFIASNSPHILNLEKVYHQRPWKHQSKHQMVTMVTSQLEKK